MGGVFLFVCFPFCVPAAIYFTFTLAYWRFVRHGLRYDSLCLVTGKVAILCYLCSNLLDN